MQPYLVSHVKKFIPTEFQTECVKILQEDISYLGPERIAGLGVSQKELAAWLKGKK